MRDAQQLAASDTPDGLAMDNPVAPPRATSRWRSRPVIGVTGPDRGGLAAWAMTQMLVGLAGGRAVRLTPESPKPHLRIDGLVIGGGADVGPGLYGQEPVLEELRRERQWWHRLAELPLYPLLFVFRKVLSSGSKRTVDPDRDRLEMSLIDRAVRDGLPILGICRGAQLLNVYFGGTLRRDIRGFYTETPHVYTALPRKLISMAPHSRLGRVLQCDSCRVNAMHLQAIDRVGEPLSVCAREANDLVQAVEHRELPFVVGVQWHPEFMPQQPSQRAIFRALVAASREREQAPQRSEPGEVTRPLAAPARST